MSLWHLFHIITGSRLFKKIYSIFSAACIIIPDRAYLSLMYPIRMHTRLNLNNPTTFNEKIQWLKLYYKDKDYARFVDKYTVRKFVAERIGENHLIPLVGVYDNVEDIEYEELPDEFVVKCTHDSGSVILCNSKQDLMKNTSKLKSALKRKYYLSSRDYSYKGIKPRIIIEHRLKNNGRGLRDYKFYCFDGAPRYLYISEGLENHSTAHISFYDIDMRVAPFRRSDYCPLDYQPAKPRKYDEMIEIAKKLSEGFIFVRVDMYEVDGNIYFSEMTFAPCGGYMPFEPKTYDKILGSHIILPN